MKTTIYIDKSLTPRYSPTGWPAPPGRYFTHYTVNGETAVTGQRAWELFRDALEKAKAESVEITLDEPLKTAINRMNVAPDSFVTEAEIGEVEIVKQTQHIPNGVWVDSIHWDGVLIVHGRRKVARVKPQTKEQKHMPDTSESAHHSTDTPYNIGYRQGHHNATNGLKDRILHAFNHITDADNAYEALERVLDELKIK